MEVPASLPMPSWLYEWATGLNARLFQWATGRLPASSVTLQAVRIPADGSAPHIIQLSTVDVHAAGNADCCFGHIPDFRPYWGKNLGWQWRDVIQFTARDQSLPGLNGLYFGWKSFAMEMLPLSKYTGFCGDAFIVKAVAREYAEDEWMEEYDEYGRARYDDVFPDAFLESPLLKMVLERLHDR
ncbi:hypothetical protein LPUS_11162 [Lasallia pustulata]|uniref:Uncharacterized protein n=1 Tax=Lasallia pustulata TaxID=136370 RepID=A0A1W5DBF5_9LECA|nr:hypothetical protein LPUS_11162 [Lasallia pustulata]